MKKPSLESNDISDLWIGQSQDLLKELHILTRDGKLNQDSKRKLKQVYHLVQLIEPYIEKSFTKNENPNIVDLASGKSYLGFMLYDLILRNKENGHIQSLESRSELQEKSKKLAVLAKFDRMEFTTGLINDLKWDSTKPLSLVCALHACDKATDDVILFGLKNNAENFAIVPCCQAELSQKLQAPELSRSEISSLWNYPIHSREFGSHLTNVIRVLVLKSMGYAVTVTELVGWEHSLKNEIILAEKTNNGNKKAKEQLQKLLKMIPVKPYLIESLGDLLTTE